MDLIHELKKLRAIEPDAVYAERSRRVVLSVVPAPKMTRFGLFGMLVHSIEYGSAIALVSLMLFLAVASFSTWKFLSPFKLSGLDPASLKAEAQAIDIQIKIAAVGYDAASRVSTAPMSVPLPSAPVSPQPQTQKDAAPQEATPAAGIAAPSSSPSSSPDQASPPATDEQATPDEALDQLSK